MPAAHSLAAFVFASALLLLIPGPSVLFTVSRAMVLGRRAALLNVVGNATGLWVQVLAVAVGLGSVVSRSVAVYTAVKWAGAAYIVYLGVQAIRHRAAGESSGAVAPPILRTTRVLREGFVVGVTNPKTIVFLVAVLTQFVAPGSGAVPLQILALGSIFVALALVLDSGWALVAGAARDWFAQSPHRLRRLRAAGGAIMVALGVRVAAGGQPG